MSVGKKFRSLLEADPGDIEVANGCGPKTCGTCKHWYKGPIDPNNLGKPPEGDCREGPPATTLHVVGQGQIIKLFGYPTLPAIYPACDRHTSRGLAGTDGGHGSEGAAHGDGG